MTNNLNNQQNGFHRMMNILKMQRNPQQFIQQQIARNSAFQERISQINNSMKSNNMNPKEYVLQLFKQNGISESETMEIAQMFGLKI